MLPQYRQITGTQNVNVYHNLEGRQILLDKAICAREILPTVLHASGHDRSTRRAGMLRHWSSRRPVKAPTESCQLHGRQWGPHAQRGAGPPRRLRRCGRVVCAAERTRQKYWSSRTLGSAAISRLNHCHPPFTHSTSLTVPHDSAASVSLRQGSNARTHLVGLRELSRLNWKLQ